jgi:hypothetical protein
MFSIHSKPNDPNRIVDSQNPQQSERWDHNSAYIKAGYRHKTSMGENLAMKLWAQLETICGRSAANGTYRKKS